ncbi:hypothetical protein RX411_05010 [Faecalibacterium prausnitzii]|nr:hypothetical protein [Faecalibacterium prausnitzii]
MMASTLPVGAFALEVGAGETTAAVSEQKAATPHPLGGGEKIGETFVKAYGTVYTLSGNYTQSITIETKQDITINIDDEVTITGVAKFLHVTGTGKVTINGTKDGADQNIKMKTDCDVMNTGDTGIVYLDAAGADVTCNGGDYYSEEMSDADSTYSVFCVKNGSLKLNAVTAEAGKRTDVVDCGETNSSATNSSASVEIHGGSFKASGISSGVIDCNSKGTIYNATLEMHNGGNYVLDAIGSSAELKIYNSIIVGENETSCVTVQFGGSFWAENCEFTSVGNQNYNGGLLFMLSGEATIKDSNYVAKQNGVTGILAQYLTVPGLTGPHKLTVENTKIKGCKEAFNLEYDPEGSDIELKNVTFEDNETDLYLKNSTETPTNAPQVELDEGTKDTAGAITVEVANPADGVQITTKTTGKDYQQSLKLTSKNDGWLIGYEKDADGDADGEYRYLTQRKGDTYFGLNTINATATTGEGDNATTLESYAQLKEGTPVNLTADILEGKKFARWKVEKVADGTPVTGLLDAETENTENTSFSMPEYDVIITAEYENEIVVDPGTGDSDYGGDIAAGVVIGGIAAVGAYEVGTGLYRILAMDDVAMPTNRIALAKLLWERAGKPEPESTALYSDISAEDTDAQKAARWAVEQGLMNDAEDGKFHPAFPVSKLRVCLTWNAAREMGLFDKTEA